MNEQEYKKALDDLDKEYQRNKYAIYKEYRIANNPYKIGDVITDHAKTIRIEDIRTYKGFGLPQAVFTGKKLNKDGSVAKKQDDNTIYQENVISKSNS